MKSFASLGLPSGGGAGSGSLQRAPALRLGDQESELLDDVRVEVRQAIEMTGISENILSQMMDAFASIVSNNLNGVMKVLTSVTILLAIK